MYILFLYYLLSFGFAIRLLRVIEAEVTGVDVKQPQQVLALFYFASTLDGC